MAASKVFVRHLFRFLITLHLILMFKSILVWQIVSSSESCRHDSAKERAKLERIGKEIGRNVSADGRRTVDYSANEGRNRQHEKSSSTGGVFCDGFFILSTQMTTTIMTYALDKCC